jgi:hypothetical protein
MVCPIGVPGIEGKAPAVIAVAVRPLQLLMVWEARTATCAALQQKELMSMDTPPTCRPTVRACCTFTPIRPSAEDAHAWHADGLLIVEDGRVKAAGDYAQLRHAAAGHVGCTTTAARSSRPASSTPTCTSRRPT